ncbi:hypothetical protein TIFTF001_022999 [Ficus carica]|uniref:Uncharacterized protein n=1 Tax=Ficus carica TaxID=3494 RepID=A0AA88AK54_FICCA|nr:hypothetical protein TIFTF001_022999 [Ficus carica]
MVRILGLDNKYESGFHSCEEMETESNIFDSNTQNTEARQTQRNKDRSCTWARGTTVNRATGNHRTGEEGATSRAVGHSGDNTQVQIALDLLHSNPILIYCATVQIEVRMKMAIQTPSVEFELKILSSNWRAKLPLTVYREKGKLERERESMCVEVNLHF